MVRTRTSLLFAATVSACLAVACSKDAPQGTSKDKSADTPKAQDAKGDTTKGDSAKDSKKPDTAKSDEKADAKKGDKPTMNAPWPPPKYPNEQVQPEKNEGNEDDVKRPNNEQGQDEGNGG